MVLGTAPANITVGVSTECELPVFAGPSFRPAFVHPSINAIIDNGFKTSFGHSYTVLFGFHPGGDLQAAVEAAAEGLAAEYDRELESIHTQF